MAKDDDDDKHPKQNHQQTPRSVSSSVVQLPGDIPNYSTMQEYEKEQENSSVLTSIQSIHLPSPRLPVTSPLNVFSLSYSLPLKQSSSSDWVSGSRCKIFIDAEEHNDREECSTVARNCQNGKQLIDDDSVEHATEDVGFDEGQHEDAAPCSLPSDNHLDEELPVLNAALNDFSTLNLSFNLELSSSDDEAPFRSSRISRDRSRALGPLLPIPSLRNDPEFKESTPKESTHETSSRENTLEVFLESPWDESDQSVSTEHVMSKPSRSSRDRSRNFGLLLPIPSLRDDLSDRKPRMESANKEEAEEPDEDPPSPEFPQYSHNQMETLESVIEFADDTLLQPTRSSRDHSRKLGPILPIPSLRDDLSDEKSVTPTGDKRIEINNQTIQKSPDLEFLSPLDTTFSNNESFYDAKNIDRNNRVPIPPPPSEILQLEICSPLIDEPLVPRRRRQSILEISPLMPKEKETPTRERKLLVVEESTDIPNPLAVPVESLRHEEAECDRFMDSMPLVKYKDRYILTAVPEETQDISVIEALQEQLAEALRENRQQAEKLARYNRSYEDRVTPFRDLFEDWRQEKKSRRAAEAQNALVKEVQEKVANALQLSFQKCQDLQAQLQASQARVAELEGELQTNQRGARRPTTKRR